MQAAMRVTKTEFVYLAILFVGLVAVFALNVVIGTSISSPQHLADALASPPDSPQDWEIQNWAAVRYRALFRFIVRGSWSLFFTPNDAWSFYLVFSAWSFFFFYGTVVALYFLLRALDFDHRASFIGGLLFLTAPPVLLAYRYPVATREDPLAYFLITLGLIAVIKLQSTWVALISVAAVLTRETTLVLPLSHLLASPTALTKRVLVFIAPILAYAGLRVAWGFETHPLLESFENTLKKPWETVAFLFCVFGVLWLPYLIRLFARWRNDPSMSTAWHVITQPGPLVFLLVMGATIILSRAREARIAFLLFPWAIAFALDWFRTNSEYLKSLLLRPAQVIWTMGIFGLTAGGIFWLNWTNSEALRVHLADFKNAYWLAIGTIHLAATLAIFLPLLYRRTILSREYKSI